MIEHNMTRAELEYCSLENEEFDDHFKALCHDDFYLALHKKDTSITVPILECGFWEAWIASWHTKNIKDGTVYIDIGANCGYFSVLSTRLGAHSFACEPNPEYLPLLQKTVEYNYDAIAHKFKIIDRAIIDSNQSFTWLNIFGTLLGGSSLMGSSEKKVRVKSGSLDYIFKDILKIMDPKDLVIKIDVEGAEPLVIKGALTTIKEYNPTIIMEYTPRHYQDTFFDELAELGSITMVNFDGDEEPITKEQANASDDWITLVVRCGK